MAADLALSLAAPFLEYLITPVRRQCGYILFYRSYLRELEDGVDKLKDELEGVQHKCDAAKRNAMDIEMKVTKWIDGVNGAVKDADTLLWEQPGANTVIPLHDFQSWFKRRICLDHPTVSLSQQDTIPPDVELGARKRLFYLNPVVCYKKGRKAKKTMLVVQGLNEDKMNLGDIFYEAVTIPILSAKGYESFGSRREIIENIIRALSDEKAPAIGVCGMGGVGKSTLIKEVIRLVREKKLFDDVAMAVVSQNPDVKKIQGELAVWLGLKFKDDEHVGGRAARLQKRLKPTDKMKRIGDPMETKKQHAVPPEENQDGMIFQLFQWKKSTLAPRVDQVHVEEMDEKNTKPMVEGTSDVKQKQVLIVLDDVWRGIDLEEIGIPLNGGAVKLLFTSRKQHVLSSEMGCSQNVFKLEVLKDEEPWRLFESIVGEKVGRDSKFRSIGMEVVEKCSGLPVVLKAIATTLKNCSLSEWEDALVQFKGSKDAYSNLEISIRHLESEELKALFLVCALTNNARIYVQDLIYYSMGLGLLITRTNTVRSAKDKLKALLHDLKDSSLLLKHDDQDPDDFYIHDVVREVAIKIASRDQDSLLITSEFKLKEIPPKILKNTKAISIPYVKFRKLPEGWECPELKMFLLYRRVDDPPVGISDSFFEGMKELNVLDFSGCRCDSLPSSIQFLLNLNTLCLDYCSIEDLTIIGKLKQLQILTFRGSEIARLPKEIGELSELKVLNLDNSKIEVIEPQVLGKLTNLEELHLKGSSFKRWEDEGETQPKNAKLSELNNLSNLSIVNIHVHNPNTIPEYLEFGNVAEYIIQIGDVWDWTGDYKESRILKIKLEFCRSSFLHEKWVQDLLKRTQNLHLDGIKGWQMSIHELCLDGFKELKHIHVQNNSLVQCVASSISKRLPCTAFTVLQSLFLEKLTGLEMISRGPITPNSFSKLKVIKVIDCGKLKNLFSYSMLEGVSQLEEIEVRDCEAMQVIVTVDSVATNIEAVKLKALHRVELHNLPNIMTFCSSHGVEEDGSAEVKPRSSEIVQEVLCFPTSTLFLNDQLVSFPLLKSLILSSLPKVKHIWQNNSSADVANLGHLEVSSCEALLIVIPSSLVKEVKNLETLMVRDCGLVQEVFETSDGVALNLPSNMEILSQLNNLELSNLPFLKHIWENNHQTEKVSVFQNLNLLKVVNCSSLMNLLPAALLKSLKQLTSIYIENCKDMKAVVPPENDGESGETKNIMFESLTDVWLQDLPNMVTFIWTKGSEAINFPSMKELYIEKCPKMRSFSLGNEDKSVHDELCLFDDKVRFPKMAILYLISLSSIRRIWHAEILEQSFCQLEILGVQNCQTLAGIGSLQFHNLKEININNCTSLEQPIFQFAVEEKGNEYDHGYYSMSELEKLLLFDLPKIKHVVQQDSHVVVGFPSLVDISVTDCECVIELFPIATAITLSKLEDLKVVRCNSMRQIFGRDEEDDEKLHSILFPCLRSILVEELHSLISIFSGISCMLGFPSLEAIQISSCSKLETLVQSHASDQMLEQSKRGVQYLFDDKVELPNLKKVELYELSILQTVWKTKLPCLTFYDRIGKIIEIKIFNCERLEEIIFESDDNGAGEKEINTTNDDPAIFHSLATVVLRNLSSMVAFIRGRKRDQSINFLSLKKLILDGCQKMRAFHLPNTEERDGESVLPLCFFDRKALVPELVLLSLVSMGSVEKIWHEEISQKCFCQIEKLIIKDCQNLVHIFPSNNIMMGGVGGGFQFQNLKKFVAIECKSLEHVVEPTSSHSVVYSFPNLVEVEMGDNPSVIDLFPISTAPTLSKLERLIILRCGSMRQVFGKDDQEKEEEDDPILLFPCLRSLQVENLDNLISFFSVTSSALHFPSLEELQASWCPKLESFVQRYATDEAKESNEREESEDFINEGLHHLFDDKVELPNLKKVQLYNLNTLQTVWNTKLPCLNICDRIGQIADITIKNCESLEEIIFESDHKGEEEIKITNNDPLVFHLLANVQLENLPNMVAFVRARRYRSITFPSLKELYVKCCQKMRAFYLLPNAEESSRESLPLCFFNHKVLVPKLVRLYIISVGSIEKVWHEEILEQSFFQLEILIVMDCQCLVNVFPPKHVTWTQRLSLFQNLKEIIIRECNSLEGSLFEFVWEEEEEKLGKHILSLPLQLEKLWLLNLPKLEHVIHPTSDVVLEFQSLVDISIADCQSLIDLFPIATTAKLSKLEKVQILRCSSMRYVFGKEAEEEEEDEDMLDLISFPCLRTICVENLNSLICFFLGTSCQPNFPFLEDLDISSCPVLKTFFQGHKSKGIHYFFYEKVFPSNYVTRSQSLQFQNLKKISINECSSLEGSLFEFVWVEREEQLGKQVFSLPQLEKLWLFDLPKLEHVIHPTSDVVLEFQSLVQIAIEDCQCLIDLFPSATAATLSKLENVEIQRCSSMRYVFGKEEEEAEEEEEDGILDLISFPCLRSIQVQKLNSLICFFLETARQHDFPSLEVLTISKCLILKTFVQRHNNENVHYLFDEKVDLPNLKKVILYDLSALQTVWKSKLPCLSICDRIGQIEEITIKRCESLEEIIFESDNNGETEIKTSTNDDPAIFHSLASVLLENLPNMTAFIRGRRSDQSINFPSLKELDIQKCQKMRAFYLQPNTQESGCESLLPLCSFFDHKVEFPNLEKMELVQLSSLQTIWNNELIPYTQSCTSLKSLTVSECNDLQHIFPPARLKVEGGELVICLRELKNLLLIRLPSLTSFSSSANCIFELPSLEEVVVTECPNLKVFSSNSVVAPKLSKVLLTEEETDDQARWDGDLNATIQNLHKEIQLVSSVSNALI